MYFRYFQVSLKSDHNYLLLSGLHFNSAADSYCAFNFNNNWHSHFDYQSAFHNRSQYLQSKTNLIQYHRFNFDIDL